MAEPPEFWVFTVANLIMFGFGSLLTVLSSLAYTRSGRSSFRNAAQGFGLVTLGGITEPIYQIGIRGSYHLSGRELLAMQGIEGILIAIGLGMLFYSIKGYADPAQPSASITGTDSNDSQRGSD